MHCCYAQYKLGNKKALQEMLDFMNSEDYHIRCSAVNIVKNVLNDENTAVIKSAAEKLLSREETVPVHYAAEKLLEKLNADGAAID